MELQCYVEETKATSPEEVARAMSSPPKGGVLGVIPAARAGTQHGSASCLAQAPALRLQGASSAADSAHQAPWSCNSLG